MPIKFVFIRCSIQAIFVSIYYLEVDKHTHTYTHFINARTRGIIHILTVNVSIMHRFTPVNTFQRWETAPKIEDVTRVLEPLPKTTQYGLRTGPNLLINCE